MLRLSPLSLLFLALLCAIGPARAEKWEDTFTGNEKSRWKVFGKWAPGQGGGVQLGPMAGPFAMSGIRSLASIGSPKNKVRVEVDFADIQISKDAPRTGTNQKMPADINLVVEMNDDPDNTFYDTAHPAVALIAIANRERDEMWVSVRMKPRGAAKNFGEHLAGGKIGHYKDQKLKMIVEVNAGYGFSTTLLLNNRPAWTWSGSVPDNLGSEAYLAVYQQNILEGEGSARLEQVSVDTSK